jgi:hypothetical protein
VVVTGQRPGPLTSREEQHHHRITGHSVPLNRGAPVSNARRIVGDLISYRNDRKGSALTAGKAEGARASIPVRVWICVGLTRSRSMCVKHITSTTGNVLVSTAG